MSHLHDLFSTIGASKTEEIGHATNWTMFSVSYETPVQTVKGYYLHLRRACPQKEGAGHNIREWKRLTRESPYIGLVAPQHPFLRNRDAIMGDFGFDQLVTTQDLLTKSIGQHLTFRTYDTDPNFVIPDLEDPETKAPKGDALNALTEWFLSPNSCPLAVLLADGGVGKTTVARHLANCLAQSSRRIIPLLIESEFWRTSLHARLDLTSILDASLARRLANPSRLLSDPKAFDTLVREGLLYIIFDGFDELCLNPNFSDSAADIINRYVSEVDVSAESMNNVRILLTSRESYWQSIKDSVSSINHCAFRLLGFSNAQRQEYFGNRLTDHVMRDTAGRVASEVAGALYPSVPKAESNAERLSGTPFVLDLVAQAVESGEIVNPYEIDPLEPIVRAICKRENIRQKLDIPPDKQIEIFEELFRDFVASIPPGEIKLYVSGIANVSDDSVIQRFQSHFLLRRATDGNLHPRYDVLRIYFIARYLASSLLARGETAPAGSFTRILASTQGDGSPVLDWLAAQLNKQAEGHLNEAFAHALRMLSQKDALANRVTAAFALSDLARRLIELRNESKQANAVILKRLISTDSAGIIDAHFSGEIKGYDFSGFRFRVCEFRDVTFRYCSFSNSTSFESCTFDGYLGFTACTDDTAVQFSSDCRLSERAELTVATLKQRTPRRDAMKALAEEAVERALRKLRGKYGFQSIQWANRLKGFPRGNPFSSTVWDELLRVGIVEQHHISNVADGGINVPDTVEVKREIIALFDNATFGLRLRRAVDAIAK